MPLIMVDGWSSTHSRIMTLCIHSTLPSNLTTVEILPAYQSKPLAQSSKWLCSLCRFYKCYHQLLDPISISRFLNNTSPDKILFTKNIWMADKKLPYLWQHEIMQLETTSCRFFFRKVTVSKGRFTRSI